MAEMLIPVAGSVISGLISGDASQSAAQTQAAAGTQAIEAQQRALAEQRALQEPFRQAGLGALGQLTAGTAPGGSMVSPFTMAQGLPQMQPFKMQGSEAERYARETALDAMLNQMQRGGQSLSTNAIVGAGKLAGDIGSQYENQAFNQYLLGGGQEFSQALAGRQQQFDEFLRNRAMQLQPLQYLTGLGQAEASGTASDVGAAGANIAGLTTGIGNVQAAGTMGQAGALAGIPNTISQMYYMKDILKPPTTSAIPAGGDLNYPFSTGQFPTAPSYTGIRV